MGFANRGVFFGITLFFLVGGLALVALGSSDAVTGLLDANATADSDPAGEVLPLIGVIWAGVAGLLLVVGLAISRSGSRDSRLARKGKQAPARIESVATTGVVMNNVNVGVRIAVTVMPPGEHEFGATIKTYVPTSAVPQAGDVALVAYDPGNRGSITFVSDPRNSVGGGKTLVAPDGQPLWKARGAGAQAAAEQPATAQRAAEQPATAQAVPAQAAAANTVPAPPKDGLTVVDQLERLAALHEKGALTDEEFQAQKYRVLTSS